MGGIAALLGAGSQIAGILSGLGITGGGAKPKIQGKLTSGDISAMFAAMTAEQREWLNARMQENPRSRGKPFDASSVWHHYNGGDDGVVSSVEGQRFVQYVEQLATTMGLAGGVAAGGGGGALPSTKAPTGGAQVTSGTGQQPQISQGLGIQYGGGFGLSFGSALGGIPIWMLVIAAAVVVWLIVKKN